MTLASPVRALLLTAGLGTRLQPLTHDWPKCLMPIGDRPLLEYWLETIYAVGVRQVLVNLHHHANAVSSFLDRARFREWVSRTYEPQLLGTAATLRHNRDFFERETTLLVHADNWCQCDFGAFLDFHARRRPAQCPITMMTFDADHPQSCGIVELDAQGIVVGFHEKVPEPPGNRASAAVYLLEPEVLDWLSQHPQITDFSREVIPQFVGRIATWQNDQILRDIGTVESLKQAQRDARPEPLWLESDPWQREFERHPIRRAIAVDRLGSEP